MAKGWDRKIPITRRGLLHYAGGWYRKDDHIFWEDADEFQLLCRMRFDRFERGRSSVVAWMVTVPADDRRWPMSLGAFEGLVAEMQGGVTGEHLWRAVKRGNNFFLEPAQARAEKEDS